MVNKEFFINKPLYYLFKQIRKIYLNSSLYNRKISKIFKGNLDYIPSLSILDCIVKNKNRDCRIENYNIENVWSNKNLVEKDFRKLHSFFWLFTIDLKSSHNITQSVILKWIENNQNFNSNSWEIDTLSKRIISWVSNSNIFYHSSDNNFKSKFNNSIKKQINHLINEVNKTTKNNNKMLGCTATILGGLSFNNNSKYLNSGIGLLKNIINTAFDKNGFPKSRNPRELLFYTRYFIFIREILIDSNNEVPEQLNEIIYYLGKSYNFFFPGKFSKFLFNGSHYKDNTSFKNYLYNNSYKFKNTDNSMGGYAIYKNKKSTIIFDLGDSPEKKFSKDYQSGALSFEIFYDNEKIITNCGYYQNFRHQLNILSKSTAAHSTLSIDNQSSCTFKKSITGQSYLNSDLKIINKNVYFDENVWEGEGTHDGYLKKYGILHYRKIRFYPKICTYKGEDKIISKKKFLNLNFDVRFHLSPETNAIKTQDQKSILIQLGKTGWKFTSNKNNFGLETGLFFGKKNSYSENQNIYIIGDLLKEEEIINWEIKKI